MILGPWGGTFGGGTLVRCVRWGGGGGGWPMCCGGAGCPCIILDVLALCKLFHSRAHQRLCTANSPSAIDSVYNSRSGCSVVVMNSSHSANRFREKIHVTKGPRDKVANQIQTPGNLPPRTKKITTLSRFPPQKFFTRDVGHFPGTGHAATHTKTKFPAHPVSALEGESSANSKERF